jgi:type I restriction enzyme, S subunit
MTSNMIGKVIQRSWMNLNGLRLDSGPYLSGAFEARVALNRLQAKKEPLHKVTLGGIEGIVNAGRVPRTWVHDPAFGTPFLSSTDILQADLSRVSLIAKSAVDQNKKLLIREGWTLITRSGTIGRMAYSRPDMDGLACTEDVLRVIPDPKRVLPGYLYAYLSSRYGVPQVVSGTYGAVIEHIEPGHIANLPVPRLGDEIERKTHDLVNRAARLRAEASVIHQKATNLFYQVTGLPIPESEYRLKKPYISQVSSNQVQDRMGGLFHVQYHLSLLDHLLRLPTTKRTTIGALAKEIREPARIKRVQIEDSTYGLPFFGTSAIMWNDPVPSYYIPKSMANIQQFVVDERMVLIPRSGQLPGIIGQVVLPYGGMIGGAVSEHAIRVVSDTPELAGYLFIALSSAYGRRQLKSRAYGSSIPTLDVNMVSKTIIPKVSGDELREIGQLGFSIARLRDEAIKDEQQARQTIEEAIERGA